MDEQTSSDYATGDPSRGRNTRNLVPYDTTRPFGTHADMLRLTPRFIVCENRGKSGCDTYDRCGSDKIPIVPRNKLDWSGNHCRTCPNAGIVLRGAKEDGSMGEVLMRWDRGTKKTQLMVWGDYYEWTRSQRLPLRWAFQEFMEAWGVTGLLKNKVPTQQQQQQLTLANQPALPQYTDQNIPYYLGEPPEARGERILRGVGVDMNSSPIPGPPPPSSPSPRDQELRQSLRQQLGLQPSRPRWWSPSYKHPARSNES